MKNNFRCSRCRLWKRNDLRVICAIWMICAIYLYILYISSYWISARWAIRQNVYWIVNIYPSILSFELLEIYISDSHGIYSTQRQNKIVFTETLLKFILNLLLKSLLDLNIIEVHLKRKSIWMDKRFQELVFHIY